MPRAPQSEHMSVASKLDCCDGLQGAEREPFGHTSALSRSGGAKSPAGP